MNQKGFVNIIAIGIVAAILLGVAVYFLLVKQAIMPSQTQPSSPNDEIIIYAAGQTKHISAYEPKFLVLKKEIEELAEATDNKFLSSEGSDFTATYFAKAKKEDYGIELSYGIPHRLSIGYKEDAIAKKEIAKVFVPFTSQVLQITGICFNETTCLRTVEKNKLLEAIDTIFQDFLQDISLIPFRNAEIPSRLPFKICTYDGDEARCGMLIVAIAEDVTTRELEGISKLVSESKGRVIYTSVDLRIFYMEFKEDTDLFAFKNEIIGMPGVARAFYNALVRLES